MSMHDAQFNNVKVMNPSSSSTSDSNVPVSLRDQVLFSTSQLQEQLLKAVDKLSQAGQRNNLSLSEQHTASSQVSAQPIHIPTANRTTSTKFVWNHQSAVGVNRGRNTSGKTLSKKKKIPKWTHTFICLSSPKQTSIPDGNEREKLKLAGLGEMSICLNLCAEAWEIKEELLFTFPKLNNAGGFELLRVAECGGRMLDVIAMPKGGFTVTYLKAVVHSAKIYVRPAPFKQS